MPVPFRRQGKARKAKRRTHQGNDAPTITVCTNCGSKIRSHKVCQGCGYYKGKQVIKVDEQE